jgi:YVTN family beta-propeller protein
VSSATHDRERPTGARRPHHRATALAATLALAATGLTAVAAPAYAADGPLAYVSNSYGTTVSVINTATNTVSATISGFNDPTGIVVAPPTTPTVTALSPTTGPAAGGNTVTITGTNLSGATAVAFGPGNNATNISCTATTCTATAPPAAAGTVDVQVTTPGGTSATSSADQYTYTRTAAVLAWAQPAAIAFGTALSSTQFDATASVPGTFTYTYTPAAGTVLQPGTQNLTATFTPTNTAYYTGGTISTTITVGFTQPCITGTHIGALTIANGQSVCVSPGGSIDGTVTISPGGALYVNGGSINGMVKSTGAAAVTACSSTWAGALILTGGTGPVTFGGTGCASNTISGAVTITTNTRARGQVSRHVTSRIGHPREPVAASA